MNMYQEEKMAMPESKQQLTLMLALENLQEKNRQLKELKQLSIRLNEKFNRTEGMIKDGGTMKEIPNVKNPNLIELFMDLADDMQKSINEIGNNTERVLNMIE